MGAPWSGSRGETGRHAGAAAAWVPYGRQQGETGRHAGVEAGVWASYGAAAWKTQDAMQEQEQEQEYGRLLWGAAVETQDTIEEQEQEYGRPTLLGKERHRAVTGQQDALKGGR